jgi:hypothetical protein
LLYPSDVQTEQANVSDTRGREGETGRPCVHSAVSHTRDRLGIRPELDGGEGGGKGAKNPTAGETSPSDTPLHNSRQSIQVKAKSLVDLVEKPHASSDRLRELASERKKVVDSRDDIAKLFGGPTAFLLV